ncbi:MAG: hypothetical protein HOE14_08370 [Gemmatimonadales bacterium]|jgi:hypothetical protein|nr:hypothetical protein [Gemmatimonadales bacterium]
MVIREFNWQSLPSSHITEVSGYDEADDATLVQARVFEVTLQDLRFIDNQDNPQLYETLCSISTAYNAARIPCDSCPMIWGEIDGLRVIFANQFGYGTVTTTRQLLESL